MKVYCKFCGADFHSPTTDVECPSCGSSESGDFIFKESDPIETDHPLIRKWVEIGRNNYWIATSWDPPFNEHSFYECHTFSELIDKLKSGCWSKGTAFFFRDFAFINQVNGGDEWLVIRGELPFESWSCGRVINDYGVDYFATDFYKMTRATDEELKRLHYGRIPVPNEFEIDGITFNRDEGVK